MNLDNPENVRRAALAINDIRAEASFKEGRGATDEEMAIAALVALSDSPPEKSLDSLLRIEDELTWLVRASAMPVGPCRDIEAARELIAKAIKDLKA